MSQLRLGWVRLCSLNMIRLDKIILYSLNMIRFSGWILRLDQIRLD